MFFFIGGGMEGRLISFSLFVISLILKLKVFCFGKFFRFGYFRIVGYFCLYYRSCTRVFGLGFVY